ncbi:MAG: 2-oxo acid dehydrogenase subunit E2 [Spirosomaceae bacterium]|nr:2-oxo acid dehydrogenase subunit E2 [Spirosomataceae bacterium]
MAEVIRMPKMSDTMTEGVIATWHKKVGDVVKSGDILAEVETDKATMDMESYYDGTLLYIGVEKGQAVPVDAIIAVIGKAGEEYQSLLNGTTVPAKEEPKVESVAAPTAPVATAPVASVNASIIRMPKMSDTMTEGVIHSWLKKVGDKVKSGDLLAEVETDKATMEMEAYEEGTLLYIAAEAGQSVPVDAVIAIIGEAGADYKALLAAPTAPLATTVAEPTKEAAPAPAPAPQAEVASPKAESTKTSDGRILASPLAKKLASDKGINLADVNGSGEGGRIIKSDVDNFVPTAKPAAQAASPATTIVAPLGVESSEQIPLTQMRKAIARSLAESQSSAVDFQLTMEINMDKAMEARTIMNEASPVKISFNDMILKACGVALKKHPNVNSSWRDDHIRRNQHNGKLQPKDWEGNTFTVSNLGMFGIEQFTSIINNPKNESCILSVGGIKEVVAVKNGQFYATNVMKVTLTCDHRVVDGATGAAFLVTLKELIEEPYRLLV